MTAITSMALMGFFVWSGVASATSTVALSAPSVVATTTQQSLSIKLTAYNAVPDQTDSDPEMTASGAHSNAAVIAARSRDLADQLPYGTVIEIDSPAPSATCGYALVQHLIGYRVIADTMNEKMRQKVDVQLDQNDTVNVGGEQINPAIALGVCDTQVKIVGTIALKDIPQTQAELALMVSQADQQDQTQNQTFAVR